MHDLKTRGLRKPLTRRSVVAGGLGAAATLAYPHVAPARSFDNPPVFYSDHHQFTILEPSLVMAPTTLSGLDGKPKILKPASGKVTLVSFWATWCVFCKTDIPALAKLKASMGKRIDVAAVSIDKGDRGDVKLFLSDLSVAGLPIYLDPNGIVAGTDAASGQQFPLYGMPITYLVTPDQHIAGYIAGTADWLSKPGQDLLSYYS
ncbi:TlpA disulfide reductase family protein [Rhizobium tumorigenes]|uniref:TlpA disulfide reductase family protein n=1 Tax=Rhizobium tumorigenes TaxID=2041385 RepID=A0AAF1KWS5_9HYPH|nr:TlpA disulfide reductase family protein [Rhizobium tumorigenes]WFR99251.1 TlpA disulfide reductase family protein [Rhizobium tumorigenes]